MLIGYVSRVFQIHLLSFFIFSQCCRSIPTGGSIREVSSSKEDHLPHETSFHLALFNPTILQVFYDSISLSPSKWHSINSQASQADAKCKSRVPLPHIYRRGPPRKPAKLKEAPPAPKALKSPSSTPHKAKSSWNPFKGNPFRGKNVIIRKTKSTVSKGKAPLAVGVYPDPLPPAPRPPSPKIDSFDKYQIGTLRRERVHMGIEEARAGQPITQATHSNEPVQTVHEEARRPRTGDEVERVQAVSERTRLPSSGSSQGDNFLYEPHPTRAGSLRGHTRGGGGWL